MPVNARALLLLSAALGAAALTAGLGLWQLDRAAQKTRLQQAREARQALPPLAWPALATDAAAVAAQEHRGVDLQGRWLAAHTVYLDNRPMDGRSGFVALTPLALPDGSVVLVQRGWLPRDAADRTRIVAPSLPDGPVRLLGRIAAGPPRVYALGGADAGPIRQNLELDGFARETGLALRPLVVVQLDTAPTAAAAAADGLRRHWPQPAADVHKHHGYAAQWFGLCALVVGLTLWFQFIRPRHDHRPLGA